AGRAGAAGEPGVAAAAGLRRRLGGGQPPALLGRVPGPLWRHRAAAAHQCRHPGTAPRIRAAEGRLRGRLRARSPSRLGGDPDPFHPRRGEQMTVQKRTAARPELTAEVDRLIAGEHADPHRVLGAHPQAGDSGGVVVRAFHPRADRCAVAHPGGVVEMEKIDDRGLFEATVEVTELPGYRLRFGEGGAGWEIDDPYRFWP